MAHYIQEDVEQILKNLSGVNEHDPLPKAVEKSYWRFKKLADKIGSPVTSSDLIYSVLTSGHQMPCDAERTFLDDVDENLVEWGDPVSVKWRGRWVRGFFHGVRGGEVVAVLEDETAEERRVSPGLVRLNHSAADIEPCAEKV